MTAPWGNPPQLPNRPRVDEPIVEVTPETCGVADDLVAQALYALSLFGTCTLREAKILLSMWARRDLLTDEQVAEVLAYYQPAPSMAPPQRWSVTSAGVGVES